MPQPVSWQSLSTTDFERLDLERTVAVLPVSATEQHGPHLPVGTDALINRGIIGALRGRLDESHSVVVLPAFEVGASEEHVDYPGTLAVGPERLLPIWVDACRGVARAGIRRLVILNSHGGQRGLVDQVALRLRISAQMLVVRCNYFAFGAPAGLFDAEELRHGLHGGEAETALMMHLNPELVRKDQLANFESLGQRLAQSSTWLGVEKPVGIGWKASDLNKAGVVGGASRADPERGRAYLEHIADALAELLRETAAVPMDIISD